MPSAITWANVDSDICRHMASLGPNVLSFNELYTNGMEWPQFNILEMVHMWLVEAFDGIRNCIGLLFSKRMAYQTHLTPSTIDVRYALFEMYGKTP